MDQDWLATQFEDSRAHLQAVAYRMLGSQIEADDAVQEAWLRLSRSDATAIDNLGGWLTTVVARVCLDLLRSRDTRKETPLPADLGLVSPAPNPSEEALMAESVGLAMLVVLQTLTPSERVAFVLHDTFGLSFEEIAPIVGRSPAAARQLASRARRRVQGSPSPDASAPRETVRAFLAAAQDGDFQALLKLLDPSCVLRSDPAAVAIGAPTFLSGPEAVAGRFNGARAARVALIDGAPGLVWMHRGRPKVVFAFTLRGGKVAEIDMISDPERLAGLKVEFN
jgi:RNA polymerase sigma-70 factor (ECF subfamily)